MPERRSLPRDSPVSHFSRGANPHSPITGALPSSRSEAKPPTVWIALRIGAGMGFRFLVTYCKYTVY
jgi:hypothetical protein